MPENSVSIPKLFSRSTWAESYLACLKKQPPSPAHRQILIFFSYNPKNVNSFSLNTTSLSIYAILVRRQAFYSETQQYWSFPNMLQNLQSGIFIGSQLAHTQKGQRERYKLSLHHVCISVIVCILFGDFGGFYYGISSFKGRSVCLCVLGPAYRALNGSISVVVAKCIRHLFLIYIDPQEKLSISSHCSSSFI